MTTARRIARRWPWLFAAALAFLFVGVVWAANVVTDGTMETNPLVNWTHTDVTGTNTRTKATDQKGGGTYSLKTVSVAGKKVPFEWNDRQTVGAITGGSTVSLSLWYATLTGAGGTSTLAVEVSTNGTTWNQVWSAAVTSTTTATAVTVPATDVSAFFTASGTYQLRLRVIGTTPNTNGATSTVWWDNVVLDVTAPAPLALTLNDGSDPSNVARVCPGDGAQYVDAFTLQGNRNVAVTAATVALAPSTYQGIALIEITNDAGNATYGNLVNPSADSVTVPFVATQTAATTQYKIRITPKTGINMPARPGAVYNVTARVTGITSDAVNFSGTDTDSATVTIDNLSPSAASWSSTAAGDGYVDLNWSNPADADFAEVIVLRKSGSTITDVPTEGQAYTLPALIGASTLVYAGNLQTWRDSTVTNGQTYYYKIFAKDSCNNYSAGADAGPLQPQGIPHLTTVGDGADPISVPLCPDDGATMLDAFTLKTDVATDVVSSVVVTLASGTDAGIAKLEVTDDTGVQVFGSATNPATNVVTIPLTTTITATMTVTPYKIRVTPRTAGNMPPNTGAPYGVTGIVTGLGSSDPKSYQDSDSAVVTIDNAPPATAAWGTNNPGDLQVSLAWSNPGDPDFSNVVILRSTTAGATDALSDGSAYAEGQPVGGSTVAYVGNATSTTNTGLTNGTTYYYRIFTRDGCGNYSAGVESAGLMPRDLVPKVTAGTGAATVDSCTQLTVRVPFTGDNPVSDSTTTFERATSINGPWTAVCSGATGASPRNCVMGSLTAGTTYYLRVTFSDADGVVGQNPQIVGPVTTPTVCLPSATTAGTATARVNSCNQITVTAPFSGDGDGDGSVKVEYNTTNSWPGTTSCGTATGATPRTCIVSGLAAGTSYYVRATYSDPDGASGTTQQVLGPLTTSACGADTAAPMVMFLAPAREAVIGGNERFKVQVYDAGGLAASNPVQFSVDGGAYSASGVSLNSNYSCGNRCAVYEFTLATDPLANGPHFVTVQATDAAANVANASQPVTISNRFSLPLGAGTLLRRTHSSQLCIDCHALGAHSSQTNGSAKYGNWAIDCLTCHTPHDTRNIGLIRSTIRTPNSGMQSVDFRTLDKITDTNPQYGQLGAYDVTGSPFNDGICETCHTRTTHYRNDASGGDHTHYQGARCTNCHSHTTGFKAIGCDDCHFSPPAIGKHRSKHDEVWDSTSGKMPASYGDATSHATATQYGYACSKCHSATHKNDVTVNPSHDGTAAKPWLVEVIFSGASSGGSYSGTYAATTDLGNSGYYSYSNGTCSGTYCHSNAAPLGGTNVSVPVTWQAAATTCTSCHKTGGFGDTGFDATALSKSHAAHIQSSSGETNTYAYGCDECHASEIRNASASPWSLTTADIIDKRIHVDELKQDVVFSTTLLSSTVNQAAGSYDGTARTCAGTYCHSPGTKTSNFDPPNVNVAWGQAANCVTCHNGNAARTANKMSTGKHLQHIDISATYANNIACAACHAGTVSADETISAAGYAIHVNGSRDVSGAYAGTWGGSSTPTCTSSRCHSSGVRAGTVEYYTVNWSTGAAITDCKGCHGRHSDNAFPSAAGEPNYTNNTSLSKYNSHKAHVTSANDCKTCHASTVGTANKIDGTTPAKHMDFDGVPDITFAAPVGGTYDPSTRTCAGTSCHGGAGSSVTWGGASLTCGQCHLAAADRDDWAITNGTMAQVNSAEWTAAGHGSSAVALPGTNTCLYCHTTSAGHYDSANPFRLANYNATGDGANSVCLICHKTGQSGYNPGSGLKGATKKIDSYHFGAKHTTNNGGRRCWDCHDPHGDTNIKMVGKVLIKTSADEWGLNATRTTQTIFTSNATGAGYVSTGTGITATGVCNVCHTTAGHYTATSGDSHSSAVCTSCHPHDQAAVTDAFKNNAAGGNCIGCHGDGSGAPARRAVNADFSKQSHHVGNGSTMGGTLSNFDCVVCHAEGKVVAGTTDTTGQPHMDGKIDLRNVDSTTAYFTYDKAAIATSAGAAANWNSSNATWRTQTSTALDPFCLACHDANGATQIATLGETGATATNPFKDTTVTNNYDQVSRGGVVDIASKVVGATPTQGTFSRHAIRGQSTSRYTKYTGLGGTYQSMYEWGTFVTNMGTDENGKPNWNDTSVMGCADCHTTDGANDGTGNAHGSSSEYLLKDSTGLATEGTLTGKSYVCYRCHAVGKYDTGMTHAPNGGDYQDFTSLTGTARVTSGKGGSVFGMACMNCHGGAGGFGWIHGTNQTFGTGANGTGTARSAYRFTNGASLRYYQPATNWIGPGSCFTLASADSWGGCTQHNRSGATGLTVPNRPLNY